MAAKNVESFATVKSSILNVIKRIRETPRSHKLLSPDFSLALNAVGEMFVDLLLQKERNGNWWLSDDGEWQECSITSSGRRVPRNFLPGASTEWTWFPRTDAVRHMADRLTGPDHVVTARVGSLKLSTNVVLEQKLRFATRQDVIADASTYVKHLRHGLTDTDSKRLRIPEAISEVDAHFFDRLLTATKKVLLKEKRKGLLSHSGSVPHVCYASVETPPHKIFVCTKNYQDMTECEYMGFFAPTVNEAAFAADSIERRIVQRAKVRLWLGLDSLLEQCDSDEVEAAWDTTIDWLNESVRDPKWTA